MLLSLSWMSAVEKGRKPQTSGDRRDRLRLLRHLTSRMRTYPIYAPDNGGGDGILHFANSGSGIGRISVTADLGENYIVAYGSGIRLGFSQATITSSLVELSQSGRISVFGPNNPGIDATITGASGKPAGRSRSG